MKFTIYAEPIPKARARTVMKNGRVMSYTPKATTQAESLLRATIMDRIDPASLAFPSGTPLSVKMIFYVSKPPSVSKKRVYPVTRPDLDNYCKLVLDACNKYLWADDSQIVSIAAIKRYGQPPRIEIEIEIEGAMTARGIKELYENAKN